VSLSVATRYTGRYKDYQDVGANVNELGNFWLIDFSGRYDVGRELFKNRKYLANTYVSWVHHLLDRQPSSPSLHHSIPRRQTFAAASCTARLALGGDHRPRNPLEPASSARASFRGARRRTKRVSPAVSRVSLRICDSDQGLSSAVVVLTLESVMPALRKTTSAQRVRLRGPFA